jgi:hypothetical protein
MGMPAWSPKGTAKAQRLLLHGFVGFSSRKNFTQASPALLLQLLDSMVVIIGHCGSERHRSRDSDLG